MPPGQGYGPVNQGYNPADPFSAFDNRINYNEMVRHQMVTQYAQNVVHPATMTLAQHRAVVNQARFQYGTQQNRNLFRRRAAMERAAFTGALARGVTDFGMFEAGSVAAGAMGIGGASVAGIALPLAAAAVPMHFIGKGINQALERQSNIHNIAADVGQYAGRLGFNSSLTYNQGTSLGGMVERSMSTPGQFFSKSQQMAIHKIGLSNDLLSAKGAGASSGSIQQYTRNFEELRDTTEEVVKLLKTTVEGGMSVIKELQQTGFGSLRQIKNQVIQAKAFGGLTGLGTQNMMQIGAAGAQAVQGTPFSARAGANMYQTMATQASMMATTSPAMAQAVARAGGAGNAGGQLSSMMMNIMNSGMGTKLAAYAMNPDLSVNQNKLDRALSGNVSAYGLVSGANDVGFAMGDNRVRFGMAKRQMMNQMAEDPSKMSAGIRTLFDLWGSQRPGTSFKNRAAAFTQQFAQNPVQEDLLFNMLRGNPGMAQMVGATNAATAAANMSEFNDPYQGPIGRAISSTYRSTAGSLMRAGRNIYDVSSQAVGAFGNLGRAISSGFGRMTERAGMSAGIYGRFGRMGGDVGDVEQGFRSFFGASGPLSKRQMRALSQGVEIESLGTSDVSDAQRIVSARNITSAMSEMGVGNLNSAIQTIAVAKGNRTVGELREHSGVLEFLGISKENARNMSVSRFEHAVNAGVSGIGEFRQQMTKADDAYKKFMQTQNESQKKKIQDVLTKVSAFTKQLGQGPEATRRINSMISSSSLDNDQKSAVRNRFNFLKSKDVTPIMDDPGVSINVSSLRDKYESAKKETFGPKIRPVEWTHGSASWAMNTANALRAGGDDVIKRASKGLGMDIGQTLDVVTRARSGTDLDAAVRLAGLGEADFDNLITMSGSDFNKRYGKLIAAEKALAAGEGLDKVQRTITALGISRTGENSKLFSQLGLLGKTHQGKRLFNFGKFKESGGLSKLEGLMGMSKGALSDMASDEVSLIGTLMMNPQTFSMNERDRKIKEFESIQEAARNFDRYKSGKITIYDSKTGEDKKIQDTDLKTKEALKDKLQSMQFQAMFKDPFVQGQGGGLQTTTRTPVLNYWNNSWSL